MTTWATDDQARRATRLPVALAAATVALVGALVLFGWVDHRIGLVQLRPGQDPVQFNSALCLVLFAVALALLRTRWYRAAAVPVAVATLIGAATLVEYATGDAIGVDRLFFDPWLHVGDGEPGRIARNSAICFTVLGVAVLALIQRGRRGGTPAMLVGTASSLVAGIALVAVFGYAGGVSTTFSGLSGVAMAPLTAASMLMLSVGYISVAWGVSEGSGTPRWLPVPAGVVALAFTLFLWQALVSFGARDQTGFTAETAASAVLGIGLVFSALLALATALGQSAARRRRDAESLQATLLQRAERDELLRTAYRAISSTAALDEAFDALATALGETVSFHGAALSLIEGGRVSVVTATGRASVPIDDPVIARAVATGEASFGEGHAAVPVVIAGEPRALLTLSSRDPAAFSPATMSMLDEVTTLVGGALFTMARLDDERSQSARLRELDQLKNEFVGVVAHDLRSPMTVIGGYLDTVLNRWEQLDDEMKRELLTVASRTTKRLSTLVEDVLHVARIESGDFPYEIKPFDLGGLVRRTVDDMSAARPQRPVVAEVAPDLPFALGDEDRQWRVLTNLVSNAQKFSPDGVPVVVAVGCNETHLEVAVTDRGPGIPEEDLSRLFGKFSRLGAPDSGEKGTGLGLYICKALVEAQGGEIDAESRVGAGTTLRYTVPRARS